MQQSLKELQNVLKDLYKTETQYDIITCSYFPSAIKTPLSYQSKNYTSDEINNIVKQCGTSKFESIKKTVEESYCRDTGKITIKQNKKTFVYYVRKISKVLNLTDGFATITLFKELTADYFPTVSKYDHIINRNQTMLQHKSHDIVIAKTDAGSSLCINFNVDQDIEQTMKDIVTSVQLISKTLKNRMTKEESF